MEVWPREFTWTSKILYNQQRLAETRKTAVARWVAFVSVGVAGLANVRGWVRVPSGLVGISLEYTFALADRCTESYEKVSQTSPFLCLELTQARVCLFPFLSPSWLCVLCFVSLLRNAKYPRPEMRETSRRSDGHEWFRRLR